MLFYGLGRIVLCFEEEEDAVRDVKVDINFEGSSLYKKQEQNYSRMTRLNY